MYLYIRGIDVASFYNLAIGLWNCSDILEYVFMFHVIAIVKQADLSVTKCNYAFAINL